MTRHASILALLCAVSMPAHAEGDPGSGMAAGEDADEDSREKNDFEQELRTAIEDSQSNPLTRNIQPGADPWSVDNPTVLFTRPSFREAFEVSVDGGNLLTISITPAEALPWNTSWLLRGLRISAGSNVDDRVSTIGATWSVSWRDVRVTLPDGQLARIASSAVGVRRGCLDAASDKVDIDKQRLECEVSYAQVLATEQEKLRDALKRRWKPEVSFAASVARDHASQQRGHFKFNAAFEVQGPYGLAITGNADFVDEPVEDMQGAYTTRAGGGVALSHRPTWPKLVLTGGAKYLYCLRECMDQKSPWEFGGTIGFAISDETLVGWSLLWKDEDLRDPTVGLAFSGSFGRLPTIK